MAVEVEGEVVEGCWAVGLVGAAVFDGEVLGEAVEELCGGEAVEVADYAVVVDDVEVGGGEGYCEEVIVFFVAGVGGVGLCFFVAYEGCGSGAVVAVSDVEVGYFLEDDAVRRRRTAEAAEDKTRENSGLLLLALYCIRGISSAG